MKYLFVLGRNPLLSAAEILSYCDREKITVTDAGMNENSLFIDIGKELDSKKIINNFGGIIAIGRVILSGNEEQLLKGLEQKPIYLGRENKFNYCVLNFSDEEIFGSVLDGIKSNFSKERLKARYKGIRGRVKMQGGNIAFGAPSKIKEKELNYFLFGSKEYNLGVIEAVYNSEEVEKRDMGKPFRREELAISPRLAKILINLSQTREGETMLDPFCGIGVVLQEALLQGINVIGIDIDRNAVSGARNNVSWLRTKYKVHANDEILAADSKTAKIDGFSGVASEPSLGTILRKAPSDRDADIMIRDFEDLIIDVLNNLKKQIKSGGKIALTMPLITTNSKRKISCNVENICNRTGLEIYRFRSKLNVRFPIREFREGQVVGREIAVLE